MRKRITLVVALLVATSLGAGVVGSVAASQPDATYEPCEFPVTKTDATGEEITMEDRPERVTTTNPSAAQTMWEIGGEAQVVGVSQYALYLDGAESKANVSTAFGVDAEKVAGTEPDLVLAPNATTDEEIEALRAAELRVFHMPESEDVSDVAEKTTTIGELTGNCEGAAEANAWMEANVEAIGSATAEADRPDVLYPLGGGYVAAGDTFIDAVIELSGGNNVAADEHTGYPQISDEIVLEVDPEYILVNDPEAAVLREEPYASTTAGREGNAVFVETAWLNQPAPRSMVYATHNASSQLHADLYSEDLYVDRGAVDVEADASATQEAGADGETETEETDTVTPTEETAEDDESVVDVPGFGPAAALVALVATTLLAARADD